MPINKAPCFPFYPKDWDDIKVKRMSYEARGVYIEMLKFMWKDSGEQCKITKNEKILRKILGMTNSTLKRMISEFQNHDDPLFLEEGNYYVSKRLRREKEKQDNYRRMQAKNSAKGLKARGLKRRKPSEQPIE